MTLSPSKLLAIEGLRKEYAVRRGALRRRIGTLRALDGVDLEVAPGECMALVGESGSGKTTLGRCAVRLIEPTAGRIIFGGEDLAALAGRELRARRQRFQMVFQDPYASLDPRQRVASIVAEPLAIHTRLDGQARLARVAELLDLVGLAPEITGRFPHELSGGQRQRVGIARALAPEPELLVADEPVSSLDVSVRGQILALLADLRQRLGLTLLLIAHDMAAVEQLADRVAVMYLGRIVELSSTRELFRRPLHPYTVSLLSAVPVPDPGRRRDRIVLAGEPPSPLAPPPGCPFHPRCPIARPRCSAERPPLAAIAQEEVLLGECGRMVACFYPGEMLEGRVRNGEDPSSMRRGA
ncbi:MAG TPA: oligopeptide/dipeptide ABC transporter ATP-binding protein [Thermoanaerobaculia bacterium]|nr:oligopeptide/dipeptide ABC transporter ATP-binding protein [Thermoanaerobaculia bacterium]